MKFNSGDVPGIKTSTGTTVKMLIHPKSTGIPATVPLSILMVILPPDTQIKEHILETCDEYEFFVSGKGILHRAGKEAGLVEANTVVYNPKGISHKVKDTGSETMSLIRVHIPPQPYYGQTRKIINKARDFFDTRPKGEPF